MGATRLAFIGIFSAASFLWKRCSYCLVEFVFFSPLSIPCRETLLEEVVYHILRPKEKAQSSFVILAEEVEAFFQVSRLVGDILHDVRSQPNGLHPQSFVAVQNRQRLLHRPHPVIHPRKNVGVTVSEAIEYSDVAKGAFSRERPHIQLF